MKMLNLNILRVMKKLFVIPLAVILTACSGLLDMLDTSGSDDPTAADIKKVLENTCWGTSGCTAPRGLQEMRLFHVTLSEGEEYDESAVTDVIFKDNTITMVFPGGGWRQTTYTYDKETKIMRFDKPLIYGATEFDGEDIYECRFVCLKLFGAEHVTLFDVAVDDWQDVDIQKNQWRLSLAPMNERQNKKLHQFDCMYGIFWSTEDMDIEGGASWAEYNVDSDRLFSRTDLDLGEIYFGLEYTMPTEEQARKLIDNCYALTDVSSKGEKRVLVGNEQGYVILPMPENKGEELGFWLKGGSALVYSYGDEQTVDGDYLVTLSILPKSETATRQFHVRPVLK